MNERGTRRLSLAISEGDGISVLVEVAAPDAAKAAEEQGADGIVVRNSGSAVRDSTELPILWCPDGPEAADAVGADACLLVVDRYGEDWERFADDHARALELGLDSVVEVRDEEELQAALEHVDPEIFLLGGESPDPDAPAIDHVLELLPDVPAGKLAVADLPDATHDEVDALERAGVDAVVVNASDVRELVGDEPPPSEPESRWGGPATILGLVLVGAAALRLVGLRYGLPDGGLLNPDEELVVPRAWAITHGAGVDPSPFFDWPSLLLYVQAPFQAWQDAPSYLTARIVGVAIGLVGVAAAWWLGERSYGVLAGGVAAVATAVAGVHVAYSRMAVTDVLLTTLVTIALGLLVTRRYELAGLVIGAATAAKWPGALVLVPLAVAAWGQWRRLAYAGGLALAGFVVASPFAVVHVGEAASDWWRGLSRARDGSLGPADDSFSAVAFTSSLWDALGPALVVALIGLAVALARRDLADRVLASFVGVYFLALLPLASHPARYVLPLVPVLGVLAGRFRSFAPVTLLLLVVPFAWTVRDTRELTMPDTGTAFVRLDERLPSRR